MPHTRFCVSAYDVEEAYGGPEEGGWWYNAGDLVRVVRVFPTWDQAVTFCRRMNIKLRSRTFGPNTGRRELHSVLSEGEIQVRVDESLPPLFFPAERPHYE